MSVAFSPDHKTLASGSADGIIILWDVTDPRKPALGLRLTGHKNSVLSVAFSPDPDQKTLASGSADKTIIFWDVVGQKQIGKPLTGHEDSVSSVAFSPDGKTLASGSADKTVIFWDYSFSFESLRSRACRRANRNLTDGEWKVYMEDKLGDKPRKTCPDLP